MKDTIKKDSPEGQFLLVVWRTMLGMAGPISEQYRWMLTGIAAVLAVLIGNLQSIQAVVADGYLKLSISMLIASVFLASIAYLLSIALRTRNDVTHQLETTLYSPEAKPVLEQIKLSQLELMTEMRRPFFGPLGWLMKSAAEKGADDPFANEKSSIRLIVWQAYAMWCGMICAAVSLVILVMGLK